MKTAILFLLFSTVGFAQAPVSLNAVENHACKPKRVARKVIRRPPAKLTEEPALKPTTPANIQVAGSTQSQEVTIIIDEVCPDAPKTVEKAPAATVSEESPRDPLLVFGLRAALGGWTEDSRGRGLGLLGARLRFPRARLALEGNTQFYWGHGLQALFYPLQGQKLNVHVNAGLLWFYHRAMSVADVPRDMDMSVGAGLEYNVSRRLALTADLRTTVPNPAVLGKLSYADDSGRFVNVGNVVGNALWNSQLMLGVMVRTW